MGPLELTKNLNDFAQSYAETLALKDKMEGSSFEKRDKACGGSTGESLYHLFTKSKTFTITGAKVVDFWYEQIKDYDFDNSTGKGNKVIGNFSQIVWKDTTQLGVGIAKSSKSSVFVVANYQPNGNYLSKFADNVFPVQLDEKTKEELEKELKKEQEKKEQEEKEKEKWRKEMEEKEKLKKEKKEKEKMEQLKLDKIEQEENDQILKEILNDENTGKELKSFNSKIPADKGHYLSISLKKQKNSIFVPTQEDLERFRRDGLKRHNYYRKYHQVEPLILTKKLSDYSQYYAETLAEKNIMQHSDEKETEKIYGGWTGENLYTYWTSASNLKLTGADGVDRWYDEIKDYDFRKGDTKNGRPIGHFTQLVWKGSTKVGMGVARNSENHVYVVANYYFGGNIVGSFKTNVLPAKIKK